MSVIQDYISREAKDYEYKKLKEVAFFPIPSNSFTAGAEMMVKHLFGFAEWFNDLQAEWDHDTDQYMVPEDYKDDPKGGLIAVCKGYTTEEILDQYFSSLQI